MSEHLPFHPPENNHAQTMTKMTPMSSQVRPWGRPPGRARRTRPAARNAIASAARMYLAATTARHIWARSRCCRHAGALVLNSGVPGFNKQR